MKHLSPISRDVYGYKTTATNTVYLLCISRSYLLDWFTDSTATFNAVLCKSRPQISNLYIAFMSLLLYGTQVCSASDWKLGAGPGHEVIVLRAGVTYMYIHVETTFCLYVSLKIHPLPRVK